MPDDPRLERENKFLTTDS